MKIGKLLENLSLEHLTKSLLWIIEYAQYSILDEPYCIRNMFEEITVMRDDEARTIEVFEHILDDILRVEVEVIRRFIHDDDVWLGEEHFREGDLGALPS